MQHAERNPLSIRCLAVLLGTVVALGSVTPVARAQEPAVAPRPDPAEAAMAEAAALLARGRFDEAVAQLSEAVQLSTAPEARGRRLRALLRLAEAQRALGRYRDATRSLEKARDLAQSTGEPAKLAAALGALGDLHIATGPPDAAQRYLEQALVQARASGDAGLTAGVLNNLGNLRSFGSQHGEALAAYAESAELAARAGRPLLAARALANAARAALASGDATLADELADAAYEATRSLAASYDKAGLLISIGRTGGRIDARSERRLRSQRQLAEALEIANDLSNARLASYALGYLGALYEEEGRLQDALGLSRRAIFQSQQANAPESGYLWHWQAGRILAVLGARAAAVAEYEQAVGILQSLRHEMNAGYDSSGTSFRDSVGPVYFELVDLLLRSAAASGDPERAQALLRSARDFTEKLKAAELTDYLQDDCVAALQAKLKQVEEAATNAVIVYPIALPDRVELLLSWPDGRMSRHATPVTAGALADEVARFRGLLENRITNAYLPHAQKLYQWLIAPFAGELAKLDVDTLVFVPDPNLRTIPMAALHDGEHFLIERYATAVTPGVELTDPRPIQRDELEVLLAGLSIPEQGYPGLSHVSTELSNVAGIVGGKVMLDTEFRVEELEDELRSGDYNVVHIATHGEISENVADSFLLAHEGRLSMDRLEETVGLLRYRETPLELLTLSACDTAASDERAALGLSGIAVKAGARSALGTLWRVNDLAAAILVTEFYRQLRDESASRAVALQRAQIALRGDFRYRHPGYWSAFLLISDWL